ncbi:hypothetical protein L3085_21705 [Bacillus subtilis]|nr:hypothetical protein [Bacillus subtilis]
MGIYKQGYWGQHKGLFAFIVYDHPPILSIKTIEVIIIFMFTINIAIIIII